ncbi:hypothetical protein JMN10_08130 [Capnocytophaga genosp. AHN8471]|uniref:Uncharacterized protein n=1 Tax=Capnocytophaga genosp. AHN8471 TaxID=327574 RepID=A0ABS1YYM3_9FLAO|nr:hypothetical protein [Capnocytophaga genosp. AHN8471]MBM0651516.1 hypothetical protein [Capnocytophaga genosp. AHN8471]MBM0662146.1 hypothetical protein [Capnocytophaga genosp. AHN8471]
MSSVTSNSCTSLVTRLKEHLHTLTDCEYYIVGTHSFTKAMQELLLNEKVPAEFIFKDDFGSAS